MKFAAVILLVCLSIKALGGIDENEVYCYIKSIGIRNPEIVLKQAIYESGHFKSLVCLKKNNLFGFRSVVIYKSFKTWQESIDYYKRWQDKHYTDTTEDYYHFLQRINYSGYKNFNYSSQLKKVRIRASLKCADDEGQ
ncbi:MAG TPA: glucosaminidase domain-containing protein [Chitinophagaceae bacterium]|nr:glucosaminidase domain-containing protein [Chitinophagaceae bacterium]